MFIVVKVPAFIQWLMLTFLLSVTESDGVYNTDCELDSISNETNKKYFAVISHWLALLFLISVYW